VCSARVNAHKSCRPKYACYFKLEFEMPGSMSKAPRFSNILKAQVSGATAGSQKVDIIHHSEFNLG
jgi:hypothetical protein